MTERAWGPEELKKEATRTLSDAEFIKDGAKYVMDPGASFPRLDLGDEVKETSKTQREDNRRAERQELAKITVEAGKGVLGLNQEELEQVQQALGLYSHGLERVQPKINWLRQEYFEPDIRSDAGFAVKSTLGLDMSEFQETWHLSKDVPKALKPEELEVLEQFLRDSREAGEPETLPRAYLEKFQEIVHLLRLRFEAILRGETTPEIKDLKW